MTSPTHFLEVRLEGKPSAVREGLAHIRAELAALGETENFLGRLETVLAEVLNNIVEHAFKPGSNGEITIHLRKGRHDWHIRVDDTGNCMPNTAVPNGDLPSLETDFYNLPEGGFGWALVKMLANQVRYVRHEGGNRLEFLLPLAWDAE